MKKRKSTSYLIVSSCDMGIDKDIIKVYAQVAKYYKAKVIHLGPTATRQEFNQFHRLSTAVAVAEAQLDNAQTDAQYETAHHRLAFLEREQKNVQSAEDGRVETLLRHFKKLTCVTTPEISLPKLFNKKRKGLSVKSEGIELSKFLFLSPIPPSSPRATRVTMPSVALNYLKDSGKNWIVAHPVPSIDVIPKPGLNQAHNFFTVGCLLSPTQPCKTQDQYKYGHMPCAILVTIDAANGEFHPKQMHIDYIKRGTNATQQPVVLDDGLVFSTTSVREVKSDDKGTASFDNHAPFTHPGVLGCLRGLNILHQPAHLIDGGDASDFHSVCRHNEGLPGEGEGLRLVDDLKTVRRLLDAEANVPSIKYKTLLDSNHHNWLTRFVMKNPALIGLLDWKTLSEGMFSDWRLILLEGGENEIFYFGDFPLRHGDKEGALRSAERIFKKGKYLRGHLHKLVAFRRAVQVGAGSSLGLKYTENEINSWQNHIVSLTKFLGIAAVNPKIVLHDKKRKVSRIAYRNHVYEMDQYELVEKI